MKEDQINFTESEQQELEQLNGQMKKSKGDVDLKKLITKITLIREKALQRTEKD